MLPWLLNLYLPQEQTISNAFILAVSRSWEASRNRRFDDYLTLVLNRDLIEISRIRQRGQLPRLLARLAGQTGQILNVAKVAASINMEATTAENYTNLLEAVFVISKLPAWGATFSSRLSAKPKIHVVDSGIASRLLRLTPKRMATLEPSLLLSVQLRTKRVSEQEGATASEMGCNNSWNIYIEVGSVRCPKLEIAKARRKSLAKPGKTQSMSLFLQ